MKLSNMQEYLKLLPTVKDAPQRSVSLVYDQEADVMYVNFQKPGVATDSELTDDDVIVRYQDDEIIGFTVLHASQRP
jgi:uncharacterized protein YuzE